MSEISKYEDQKKKLEGICDENHLVAIFHHSNYPITLTVKPLTSLDEQMTMLKNADEKGYISPDASIVFFMRDGVLGYKTSETFTISKALFSKLENIFKRMHDFWLQFFFRDLMEKGVLTKSNMPTIASEDDMPDDAEPLEEYEDEDGENGDTRDTDETAADSQSFSLDDLDIKRAVSIIRIHNTATISLLQREMGVTFTKGQRLMDALEELGVVGPFNGSQPREVLPVDEPEDAPESEWDKENGEGRT